MWKNGGFEEHSFTSQSILLFFYNLEADHQKQVHKNYLQVQNLELIQSRRKSKRDRERDRKRRKDIIYLYVEEWRLRGALI